MPLKHPSEFCSLGDEIWFGSWIVFSSYIIFMHLELFFICSPFIYICCGQVVMECFAGNSCLHKELSVLSLVLLLWIPYCVCTLTCSTFWLTRICGRHIISIYLTWPPLLGFKSSATASVAAGFKLGSTGIHIVDSVMLGLLGHPEPAQLCDA